MAALNGGRCGGLGAADGGLLDVGAGADAYALDGGVVHVGEEVAVALEQGHLSGVVAAAKGGREGEK